MLFLCGCDSSSTLNDDALFETCKKGDTASLNKFIQQKNNSLNLKNKKGISPLMMSAFYGHIKNMKLLLKNGAKINSLDVSGNTALIWAIRRNYNQMYLSQKDLQSVQKRSTKRKINFLTKIISSGKKGKIIDIVELLIKKGANVNHKNILGQNPLFFAVEENDIDTVKLLLKSNANCNITDNNGVTPLCIASQKGFCDIAKLLINNGASLNHVDSSQNTPLLYAVSKENHEMIKLLIKKGADVNLKTTLTPLMKASIKGDEISIKILLENNADINIAIWSQGVPITAYSLFKGNQHNNAKIEKLLKPNKTPTIPNRN